jgi:hypothetical protein
MLKLLLSASVVAILVGVSMPIANAQYYGDDGYRPRPRYDDDYRPSRRHYDDDDYYRPRRHHDEDEDYHRHAPVIIIHPPSWLHPGYGGNERPSYGGGSDVPRRPTTSGSTDNRPNWEKENRAPTKEEWDKGGGYGGKQ